LADLNEENLKQYRLVVWLNGTAPTAQQDAFQHYMETAALGWASTCRPTTTATPAGPGSSSSLPAVRSA
jgi:hypothetical protein